MPVPTEEQMQDENKVTDSVKSVIDGRRLMNFSFLGKVHSVLPNRVCKIKFHEFVQQSSSRTAIANGNKRKII